MAHPMRRQLKRIKGFRMAEGAVNCCRPGRWGNPFRIPPHTRAEAVELYRKLIEAHEALFPHVADIKGELRGKLLYCVCSLDVDCHVDYLAEIANG